MMLSGTIIQKMKQTNISADTEKTKERVSAQWKASSSGDKEKIIALADVARSTIARVYRTGSISAKLAVSLAQILNLDPLYLTGESDVPGEYTEDILNNFMEKYEYGDLLAEQKRLDKKNARKIKVEPKPSKEDDMEIEIEMPLCEVEPESVEPMTEDKIEEPKPPQTVEVPQAVLDELTEEDMILLLRALMLRAKAGGIQAESAHKLKLLLLS